MSNQDTPQKNEPLEKAQTGIQGFDEITFGGLQKGRTTLVCGGPGCGKILLATEFLVNGALKYGEPGVFMAFEETADELAENVASSKISLAELAASKKLFVDYVYIERGEIEEAGSCDLEVFFVRLADAIDSIGARRVVLDSIEVLFSGFANEAILRSELGRLFRWLKEKGVTTIVTGEKGKDNALSRYGVEEYVSDCVIQPDLGGASETSSDEGVSSLMDTWLIVRNLKSNGECNLGLYILKARGMAHSTQVREFVISDQGIELVDVYMCSEGILTGKARACQQVKEKSEEIQRQRELRRRQREFERKSKPLENRIAVLQAELIKDKEDLNQMLVQEDLRRQAVSQRQEAKAASRQLGMAAGGEENSSVPQEN
jgi:KaiC/GvpD/RAD55 family RecA-like ATPase